MPYYNRDPKRDPPTCTYMYNGQIAVWIGLRVQGHQPQLGKFTEPQKARQPKALLADLCIGVPDFASAQLESCLLGNNKDLGLLANSVLGVELRRRRFYSLCGG